MKIGKISQGAEAYIYSLEFLGFDCVLKRRIKKSYRAREIDEILRLQRTKSEAKIMGLVSSLGINSPGVLLVSKYDIVMRRIYGTGLNHILNSKGENKNLRQIFSTLGDYIAVLHNNNITHGDYTPANIIIGKRGKAYVIDFGLAEITNSIEDKALDLLLMKRSIDVKEFESFIGTYKKRCNEQKLILERLAEIEKRGRYNTRTLIVK